MVATGKESLTSTLELRDSDALYKSTGITASLTNRIAQEWTTHDLRSDLTCLLEGTVKCTKPKPPSTKETRKEAFDRYMKIIYRIPPYIKVDFDEYSDDITFEPKLFVNTPYVTPVAENTSPPAQTPNTPAKAKKKIHMRKKPVFVVEESEEEPKPVTPPPPVIHKKPAIVEEVILPEVPASPSPPPPKPAPSQKPLAPPPEPSPEPPAFLREFLTKQWFKQLYPDENSIPSSLCPDSFSLQLCEYLNICNTQFTSEILSVLERLHRRNQLQNTEQLYQKLLNLVPKMVTPNMNANEQDTLVQLTNLLIYLKSINAEIVKTLLTLTAYKELGLGERMLCMLKTLGVDEAEQWLQPELESWQSELLVNSSMWRSLYDSADSWLRIWTTRYKDHIRNLFIRSREKWKPPSFTAVDVLNHFCSVQKEEYLKRKEAAPRANSAVILPRECFSGPIHRLGETYTMARKRKPSSLILPPVRARPFLLDFPHYLSLPLPRVILSPFWTDSNKSRLRFLDHRYYILQKSNVQYYR